MEGRTLSKNTLQLKFMQRRKEAEAKGILEADRQKQLKESRWLLEKRTNALAQVDLTHPYYRSFVGRRSFGNFNPAFEKNPEDLAKSEGPAKKRRKVTTGDDYDDNDTSSSSDEDSQEGGKIAQKPSHTTNPNAPKVAIRDRAAVEKEFREFQQPNTKQAETNRGEGGGQKRGMQSALENIVDSNLATVKNTRANWRQGKQKNSQTE